jgi:vacuolar-type H+-ATPase subunit C/Vma6
MEFVPQERRDTRFPCRHIHLTDRGETVNSFYEWGTEEELEKALRESLVRTIQELEAEDGASAQVA